MRLASRTRIRAWSEVAASRLGAVPPSATRRSPSPPERRLAVLAADRDVGGAEAAQAVAALPAEEGADDEALPGLERERLPRPLALEWRRKPKNAIA
jgi:hypothetical protein